MSANLEAIISDYKIRKIGCNDGELTKFRRMSDFDTVLRKAAFALNSKNKRFSHQRRIKKVPMERAFKVFNANAKRLRSARNFEELHSLVYEITKPIVVLGELYVYDTSMRIGSYLRKLPTKVYLHAGTRKGAIVLGLDGKRDSIPMSKFHPRLRRLKAYEVEDILCIYKDQLKNGGCDLESLCLPDRSEDVTC